MCVRFIFAVHLFLCATNTLYKYVMMACANHRYDHTQSPWTRLIIIIAYFAIHSENNSWMKSFFSSLLFCKWLSEWMSVCLYVRAGSQIKLITVRGMLHAFFCYTTCLCIIVCGTRDDNYGRDDGGNVNGDTHKK